MVTEPGKVRRGRRFLGWLVAVVLLVGMIAAAGATWYFSNLLIDEMSIKDYSEDLPESVVAIDEYAITLQMAVDPATDARSLGIAGIRFGPTDEDYLQVGEVIETSGSTATRPVLTATGDSPAEGASAALESQFYPQGPKTSLGLDFSDESIETPLGPSPAWFVPADGDTWAIYSHGRGATRAEGLRMLQTSHELGMPTLLITFRDDLVGQDEDGISNFGMTEWEDLEAAVQHALDHGAEDVVLLAASTGGAISLAFLENSELADAVVGMVFDAPVTSFGQTVDLGAADMGVPAPLVASGKWLTEQRVNIDFAETDYLGRAGQLDVPTLIIHGTADETNPIEASEEFAAVAPEGLVQLEIIDGAAHVWAWNTDPGRYEAAMADHLTGVLDDG